MATTWTVQTGTDLEVHTCPSCAVVFAAPVRLLASRRESGESFY